MTTERLWRYLCDGPRCPTSAVSDSITVPPEGWRRLQSIDHIEYYRTSLYPARRRKSNLLSYEERTAGSFDLHLCPVHVAAFDAHLPRTDARPGGRGRDSHVTVSCSCGVRLDWVSAGRLIGVKPASTSERVWWRHLPEDLRWYVTREAAA